MPKWGGAAAAGIALMIMTQTATADFSPVQCAPCPSQTSFAWTYGLRAAGLQIPIELPTDLTCPFFFAGNQTNPCPHYANNLDHDRYFVANGYAKQFAFHFAQFDTEAGFDTFSFGESGGALTSLSGSPHLGWYSTTVSQALQSTPGVTRFHTDDSVTYAGVTVDQVEVCCQSTYQSGEVYMVPSTRYSGVLMGTSDTVYFKTAASCGAIDDTWTLWGGPATNDYDIYVRCNSYPTPTQYDWYGTSSDTQELVHAYAASCTCPGTWYVAVQSYSGSGTFNLVHQQHYASEHHWNLRVGTGFNATSTQISQFSQTMLQGCRHFFGATEGSQYFNNIDVWNSANCNNCGGVPCDACFLNETGSSTSSVCSGMINFRDDAYSSPEVVSHELGHKFFCLADEYVSESGLIQCGHSTMAQPNGGYLGANKNLCYGTADHGKDRDPSAPPPGVYAAWTQAYAAGKTPFFPLQTPDNYDYRNHDFNSAVCTVVLH